MPDKVLTTTVAIADQPRRRDPAFDRKLIHRCTVTQFRFTPSDGASYGHKKLDTVSSEKVYTRVPCRIRVLTIEEQEVLSRAGQITGRFVLYIAYADVPVSLQEFDASVKHQISHVMRTNGKLYDEGPFDIQGIVAPGDGYHHYRLDLLKIG